MVDSSLVYGDMKACPEWHGVATSQEEVKTKLVSVNAALDPILFADAVHNEAAISKFKMLIGTTSALPPDNIDDIWCNERMSSEADLNNLKFLLGDLENLSASCIKVTSVCNSLYLTRVLCILFQ